MAVSTVIITKIADRQVIMKAVERLRSYVLVLDHQRDIGVSEMILDAGEQHSRDPTAAEIWIDTEIEDASLTAVGISDGTTNSSFPGAGDDNVRSRPEIENYEGDEAIGLTAGEAATLKALKHDRVSQLSGPKLDSGVTEIGYGSSIK